MVSQPPALNAQSDDSSSNRPSSLLTHQSCLQKVEVIELEKGKRKYRLTGMRTVSLNVLRDFNTVSPSNSTFIAFILLVIFIGIKK